MTVTSQTVSVTIVENGETPPVFTSTIEPSGDTVVTALTPDEVQFHALFVAAVISARVSGQVPV